MVPLTVAVFWANMLKDSRERAKIKSPKEKGRFRPEKIGSVLPGG
jgi:hypothetical protein